MTTNKTTAQVNTLLDAAQKAAADVPFLLDAADHTKDPFARVAYLNTVQHNLQAVTSALTPFYHELSQHVRDLNK